MQASAKINSTLNHSNYLYLKHVSFCPYAVDDFHSKNPLIRTLNTGIFRRSRVYFLVIISPARSSIMSVMSSQTTFVSIVYSTFSSGVDQRKHQSSASLAFVRKNTPRWPLHSPHKGQVTRKRLPFDDLIRREYDIYHQYIQNYRTNKRHALNQTRLEVSLCSLIRRLFRETIVYRVNE